MENATLKMIHGRETQKEWNEEDRITKIFNDIRVTDILEYLLDRIYRWKEAEKPIDKLEDDLVRIIERIKVDKFRDMDEVFLLKEG